MIIAFLRESTSLVNDSVLRTKIHNKTKKESYAITNHTRSTKKHNRTSGTRAMHKINSIISSSTMVIIRRLSSIYRKTTVALYIGQMCPDRLGSCLFYHLSTTSRWRSTKYKTNKLALKTQHNSKTPNLTGYVHFTQLRWTQRFITWSTNLIRSSFKYSCGRLE